MIGTLYIREYRMIFGYIYKIGTRYLYPTYGVVQRTSETTQSNVCLRNLWIGLPTTPKQTWHKIIAKNGLRAQLLFAVLLQAGSQRIHWTEPSHLKSLCWGTKEEYLTLASKTETEIDILFWRVHNNIISSTIELRTSYIRYINNHGHWKNPPLNNRYYLCQTRSHYRLIYIGATIQGRLSRTHR